MVSHLLTCPNGHQWKPSDEASAGTFCCPVCGTEVSITASGTNAAGDGDTVQAATGDSTSQDPHADTSRDSPGTRRQTVLPPLDHDTFPGYELRGELGRGGMGIVYRAFDQRHRRDVALKTLRHDDPQALERFKQEFRTISGIVHSNLAAIYELISDGHVWFLTMELLEDVLDFQEFVQDGFSEHEPNSSADDMTIVLDRSPSSSGQVSGSQVERLRAALSGLVSGIAALHGAGVLHRDIKPSNVVVTRAGRVVLLDFGLAAALDQSGSHQTSENRVLGTAAYMAPEQAAGDSVSQASDWYSVGVMMYQGLTGRLPIEGRPMQMMMEKQKTLPASPSDVVSGVPDDLNNLCMALLAISPVERPSSADVLRILSTTAAPAPVAAPVRAESRSMTPLVGRDGQMQQLRDAFAAMQGGESVSVFISGRSGGGKSALVEHFLGEVAADPGTLVLRGRCYEQESVPFKALDSLIDALCRYLRRLKRADVAALLPRDAALLPRVFPVLAQIPEFAAAPLRETDIPDQQEMRRRANVALRELLQRLGDRNRLVLYIDDLQWGDVDSATLLTDLLQPPDPPVLLLIGTYRSEDEDTSPFLRRQYEIRNQREQSASLRQIAVEPLSRDDIVRLVTEILERDDEATVSAARAIADETAGNPFFATEMARAALHGAATFDRDASEQTLSLDEFLWSRAGTLPETSRTLLEVVAVAGKPIAVGSAARAAGLDGEETNALAMLRTGHMVRTSGTDDEQLVETWHDRIRESVIAHLPDTARRRRHLEVACACEHASGLDDVVVSSITVEQFAELPHEHRQTVYDLAYHYDAAGEHQRARLFAVPAARHAKRQCSLEIAEQQFLIAERGLSEAGAELQFQIAEELGEVLMLRGRYEEASVRFQQARDQAVKHGFDAHALAEIEGRIGELILKRGDMHEAAAAFCRSLKLLGMPAPVSIPVLQVLCVREIVVQTLHSLLPEIFLGTKSNDNAQRTALVARLYDRLSYAYWFSRGPAACLWAHLRGMNLAERYPPTLELAQAWSAHAPGMTLIPWYKRGLKYVDRSVEVRKSLGDLQGQGQSLHFRGVVLYTASRFEECIETCRESVRLLEQTGDWWELNVARYQVAASLYRLGDLSGAAAEAQRMHRSGLELGDPLASGISLDVWAMASTADLPADSFATEVARDRHDAQATAQTLQGEGVRLLRANQPADAAAMFERGWSVASEAGVRNAYVLPGLIWLVTTLRIQAEQIADTSPSESRTLVSKATRFLRTGRKIARKYRNDLPHALREEGILAAMSGRDARAQRLFAQSLQVADSQNAAYEVARTRLARARIAESHDWPEWRGEVAVAENDVAAFEQHLDE